MQKQDKISEAGRIAAEVTKYAKTIIKKGMPLLEIAEKIEAKIVALGGKPAFPTNLSINEIAAHYTPSHDDENLAEGLLKVDLGVHINGNLSDTAFSMDLENSKQNKDLINAAEEALENALKIITQKTKLNEIGKTIQDTIESKGFSPIVNLSGHEMAEFELHSGLTVPNFDNKNQTPIGVGLKAIEPFATVGDGKVYDGKPSGIFVLADSKNIRSPSAREILNYIAEEYQTLPFCSRWLVNKFGTKALFALRQLEENGNINQFSQLVEASHNKVAQAEHTIFIEKDKSTVTTKWK